MLIICSICRRCIEGTEIAVNFGRDERGRLHLTGICVRCYQPIEHAGEPLFAPEAAERVAVAYDSAIARIQDAAGI